MLAFVIPFALIFINRRKSQVHPQMSREMSDVEPKDDISIVNVVAKDVSKN